MKTNKNSNNKEFEENWGDQIGKSEFDTKEKTIDDSKRELTKELIMYVSPDEKWIVFCWVVSNHR